MHRLSQLVVSLAIATTVAGCAVPEWGGSLPEARPLGAQHPTYRPRASEPSMSTTAPADVAATEPTGDLSLRDALRLALLRSPELASFAWSVREAEAEQLQASLLPNPELEGEVENFGGTGEFRGTDAIETTVVLSHLVELGGKRAKRMRLAELDSRLAGWDYEAKRLAVLTDATRKFVSLAAAQEQVKLATENARLATEAAQAVANMASAGKIAPTEKLKADVEVATSEMARRNAVRALATARLRMASVWGGRQAKFTQAIGVLASLDELPPLESLAALLGQNPDLARWQTEIAQRKTALAAAKSQAIPDVTVGVGFRKAYETEGDDHAFLVTASIPLPIFDRNQGGIAKARFAVMKAHMDRNAAKVALHAELAEAYAELVTAHDEMETLREKILPMATKAYQAVQKSFREGRSGYLDMLDAQRTLVEARGQQVGSLAAYHNARATVEALIGQSIEHTTPKIPVKSTAESERSSSNN